MPEVYITWDDSDYYATLPKGVFEEESDAVLRCRELLELGATTVEITLHELNTHDDEGGRSVFWGGRLMLETKYGS